MYPFALLFFLVFPSIVLLKSLFSLELCVVEWLGLFSVSRLLTEPRSRALRPEASSAEGSSHRTAPLPRPCLRSWICCLRSTVILVMTIGFASIAIACACITALSRFPSLRLLRLCKSQYRTEVHVAWR